ncbi:hypothetical protein EII17_07760 [Clostridiales bacterium COT073_COT-073]|nr:hypothetical protein EII17_07760 [Clostridiales bacterium COT073_COT-073]
MINDIFNEQLVKKEKTSSDILKSVAIWAAALVMAAALVIFVPMVGPLIALLVIWGALVLNGRLKQEFEYSFTNGDLDIDVIYNQSKRKHLLTIDSKKILAMEKVKNKDQSVKGADKVMDCSSGLVSDNLYVLTYDVDHKKTRILIEPNDQILKGIYSFAPRSVTGRYGVSKTEE